MPGHFLRTGFGAAILAVGFGLIAASPSSAFDAGARPNYGAMTDRGIALPAVPVGRIANRHMRQSVRYTSDQSVGTIVIDPVDHYLYFVTGPTSALRYGVSVGTGAFAWSGTARVGRVDAWPRWTPPKEMIARSRNLSAYEKGLEGGLFNPMGARALYLHQGKRDTLYRIHGTSEWWSIGQDASSGCIRLLNQDVIDLASRVSVGTKVVVLPTKSLIRKRS